MTQSLILNGDQTPPFNCHGGLLKTMQPLYYRSLALAMPVRRILLLTNSMPELRSERAWSGPLAAAEAIFEFIEVFHNRTRRHSTIGDVSPVDFELQRTKAA